MQPGTGLGLAIVNGIVRSDSVRGKVEVSSDEGVGTEIRVTLEAEAQPPSSDSLSSRCLRPLTPTSVTLIGFSQEIRGYSLLREVVTYYLSGWWGLTVIFDESNLGDVIILNEDVTLLEDFIQRNDVSHPIIVLSSARRDPRPLNASEAYEKLGGLCCIVYKPCGPSSLHSALEMFDHRQSEASSPVSPFSSPSGFQYLAERRHSIPPVQESAQSDVSQAILIGDGGSVILKSAVGGISSKHNLRVLVVEDNRVNRGLLTRWLALRVRPFMPAEGSMANLPYSGLRICRGREWPGGSRYVRKIPAWLF